MICHHSAGPMAQKASVIWQPIAASPHAWRLCMGNSSLLNSSVLCQGGIDLCYGGTEGACGGQISTRKGTVWRQDGEEGGAAMHAKMLLPFLSWTHTWIHRNAPKKAGFDPKHPLGDQMVLIDATHSGLAWDKIGLLDVQKVTATDLICVLILHSSFHVCSEEFCCPHHLVLS